MILPLNLLFAFSILCKFGQTFLIPESRPPPAAFKFTTFRHSHPNQPTKPSNPVLISELFFLFW